MKKRILSIITCLALCLGLLSTTALADDTHTHCICGGSVTAGGHTHDSNTTWTAWDATGTLPTEKGNYYLTADVTLSSWWSPADGTALCLNGHTVTAASNNYAVYVGTEATFTLTDCSNNTTSGYLDATWSLWHAGSSAEEGTQSYDLTGGVITGASTANNSNTAYSAVYVGGTFHMYGGNIAGNDKWGGVMAVSGSNFNMYGGKICGNNCIGNAGGVMLTNAAFTMYGGEIAYNRGNNNSVSSGGVYVGNGATFTMSDEAKIVGNKTNGDGGGIYVEGNGRADLKGSASVTQNNGAFGGGIYVEENGTLKLTDSASVTKNTGGGIYGYAGSKILLQAGSSGQIKVSANQNGAGIRADGKLTLEGRSGEPDSIFISENKSGGIFSRSGSLTISSSTISGNTGYQGVYTEGGNVSLTISDSIISENNIGGIRMGMGTGTVKNTKITGNKNGGGIFIVFGGKMILSDVEITGNSASNLGGGIYQTGATGLTLAGKITIANNTVNSQENNLLFNSSSGGTVQIGVTDEDGTTTSLTEGSQIGVTYHQLIPTEDSPLAVTGTNDVDYSKYFTSDNAAYGIYNGDGNKVMLGVNKTITYNANGGTGTQAEDAYPINGTFTLPESTTFTPPDENKKFKGWSLSENGEIIKTHKISGNTTFYAIWYDYKVEITGVEAATGLAYNGQPHTGYTGNIQSGNYVGEYTATYAGANGTSYGPSTTAPTNAGDYTVTLSIPAGATYGGYEYAGESAPVAFTIGKAASSVGSAPTAINPTYNGTAQDLVTMGEATGGEMRYAVGTDSTTVPTEGWSTTIPTATNAGTYYVWYKVVGDHNHNDIAPACVGAVIEKAILDVSAKNYLLAVNSPVPDLTSADAYTITGFVGSDTAEVVTGAPVLSYAFDESPDMSKEGYCFIEVDPAGMSAVNYDFNTISGELQIVTCVHEFTGFSVSTSADGTASSILAKCNNGCAEFAQPAEIISIVAPEDPVYTQGEAHTASLIYDSQVDSENVVYSGAPVDAGTYTASITYGGQTASVTYTVAPRPLTIKADNKSVYVGESEPEYTYTVTGWDRSHDDEDPYSHQLSGVTATCEGVDLTKSGSYTITLSGTPKVEGFDGGSKADVSANYSFTLENGVLNVSSRPSSGGGGYTPPVQNVTVPISGDDTTIHVDASVKGDKATVKDVDLTHLDTVIGDHVNTGTVTIDFSGLNSSKPITTVEIPASAVKEIAEAVNDPTNDAQSLEIVFSNGLSIEFDAVALGEKAAQADGLDITISIENAKDARPNQKQEAALKGRPAYEITVTSGGEHISDMGGKITIHAPYELQDGEHPRGIIVWYVDEDGKRERCQTSYDNVKKQVNWKTDHLSLYMIDYCHGAAYEDVDTEAWYHEGVDYVIENELMGGYGGGVFKPNGNVTRQQVWMILARMSGKAPADMAEARVWAMETGVSDGTNPTACISRQQFATMLWRYAKETGVDVSVGEDTNILSYTDAFDISEYAVPAMQWACGAGVMGGYNDGSLKPLNNATRAHLAKMLMNYLEP